MRAGSLIRLGVFTVVAVVALGGCHVNGDAFKAKFTRSEELTAPVAGMEAIDISTNVGKIELIAADVAEVKIAAEIKVKARTEERAQELGEQVRIVAEPSGRTLRIKVIRPAGLDENKLAVDYTITAPAALALKCVTNVGDIRTAGFSGPVEARTDVGTITCRGLRGKVDLQTNVGDIKAEYAPDAPAAISVDASSNVGNVELEGPAEISAKVAAETNVGSIHSDRPLTVSGSLKQSIRASLGSGEGGISLRTNVGSIRIQ
jgi:hypothetical protein